MNRWQPKEAGWRALKTWMQTFGGTLTGVTIVSGSDAQRALLTAAFSATVASILAFAMNLEASPPSEPVDVRVTGEPIEVTTSDELLGGVPDAPDPAPEPIPDEPATRSRRKRR